MRRALPTGLLVFCLIAAGAGLAPSRLLAHDIPADVHVHVFVKPDGQRLRMLVRVPLGAMRDIAFPTREPGFLELDRAGDALRAAVSTWIAGGITVYEHGIPLAAPDIAAVRVSLPSDRSFESYDAALAHVTGPALPPDTALLWNQALLDTLLEFPMASDRSELAIESGFARLGIRVVTVIRFLPPGGAVRAFEFAGDPGRVSLDPRWHQAAARFVVLGLEHILGGVDHLLFLVCLVLPDRRLRSLVLVVTAFTVAHSITLIASAFNFAPDALWFPPLIETLIAASIVYMALENIVIAARGRFAASASGSAGPEGPADVPAGSKEAASVRTRALSRRWAITFAFGLIHGFGFSFALRETMQFAGSHLLSSLLAFNVGIEIGQVVVLLALVPALGWLFRTVASDRLGIIILSALVTHTAWHWMTERGVALAEFWPFAVDPAALATFLRWTMVLVAGTAMGAWLSRRRTRRR